MPQQRMDIRMIKDILRLKYQGGLSHERIARSLSISKGVVAKYLGLAGAAGLDWEATVDLDEASLERRLLGRSAAETRLVEADFARVHIETAQVESVLTLPYNALQYRYGVNRVFVVNAGKLAVLFGFLMLAWYGLWALHRRGGAHPHQGANRKPDAAAAQAVPAL